MQASAKELLKFAPGGVFHWVMEALQKDPNAEFQLTCTSLHLSPITGKFEDFQWNCETPSDYSIKEKKKLVWVVAILGLSRTDSAVFRYNSKANADEKVNELNKEGRVVAATPVLVEIPSYWGTHD